MSDNFDEQDEEIKDRIVFKKVEILSVFQDFSIKYYDNKFIF